MVVSRYAMTCLELFHPWSECSLLTSALLARSPSGGSRECIGTPRRHCYNPNEKFKEAVDQERGNEWRCQTSSTTEENGRPNFRAYIKQEGKGGWVEGKGRGISSWSRHQCAGRGKRYIFFQEYAVLVNETQKRHLSTESQEKLGWFKNGRSAFSGKCLKCWCCLWALV